MFLSLSLSLSLPHCPSLLFAVEAPRYQIPCGTIWLSGWVSGKHRARVAAMFENVRFVFRLIGCWFDILCLAFLPPACWLLMIPRFFLGSFFPGVPPSLFCLQLPPTRPVNDQASQRQTSEVVWQSLRPALARLATLFLRTSMFAENMQVPLCIATVICFVRVDAVFRHL